MRASELEAEFADMDGWEAESDASKLLQGLGIPVELHYDLMANIPKLRCFIPCGVSFFLYFCLFYFENYNRKIVFNKE